MRELYRLILVTALAAATALSIPSQSAAPATAGFEVPMRFIGSMPAVEVMVNGKGPFLFGIETGGQGMARLDSSFVEKLGLKAEGAAAQGADPSGRTPQQMQVVRLESLEIGGLRFSDVEAPSRNYRASPRMPQIDGMLTLNLFSEYLLTLDFVKKIIRVEKGELPPTNSAEILSYRSEGGVPVVPLQIGSATVDAHIDTGNMIGTFVVPAPIAEKLTFASAPSVVGKARTVSGEVEIKSGLVQESFRLGDQEFREPTVTFPAVADFANIGAKALRDLVITFDQPNLRLRLSRTDVPRAAPKP